MKKILLSFSAALSFFFSFSQGKYMKAADPFVASIEASRFSTAPFSIRFTEESKFGIGDIQQLFQKYLGLTTGVDELRLKQSDKSYGDITVNRYQQYYKNIKVEHGNYIATQKGNRIRYMTGDFFDIKPTTVTVPVLNESSALAKALTSVGANVYKWQVADEETFLKRETNNPAATYYPKGELVLVGDFSNADESQSNKVRLAYKFDVYAHEPMSRSYIYIDAVNGKVLLTDAIIKHLHDEKTADKKSGTSTGGSVSKHSSLTNLSPTATGTADTKYSGQVSIPTQLSGSNYILKADMATENYPLRTRNMLRGTNYNNATDFTDADNNWTSAEFDNANRDNVSLDAHWGAAKVIDYWRTKHGRASYDNNNAVINSYVHYSSAYNNAGWTGTAMIYGDGSNTNGGFSPLTALDVCGHEIGHAVCTYTASLVYNRESGGLNEGFSDIWGAAIEHFADPHETDAVPKSYFLIGEEIGLPYPNNPLRSMSNPKAEGQPDTYLGTFWRTTTSAGCPSPNSTTNDNCGVHYNSGVLNHWFYILVSGKSGTNDVGFSYNVTGIGWDDAEKIAYLGEQSLTPTANYRATRTAMFNAATTLFGACSNQAVNVLKAFDAVNVKGPELVPMVVTTSNPQQAENNSVTFTTKVSSLCSLAPVSNYILRDTLPANVTFVSATNGGTYNATNRVVSYTVNLNGGESQDFAFTVTVNSGTYFTPVNLLNEEVTSSTINPAVWATSSSTSNNWATSTVRSYRPLYSFFSSNVSTPSDQMLFSSNAITLPANPPALTFWHYYYTENLYDGGILEISTDGGTTYTQVAQANITTSTYSATIASDAGTFLSGKRAWTGSNEDWTKVTVPLTAYANQSVKFRFRFVTDNGTGAEGWYLDDIAVKNVPTIDIRSSLFTSSGVRMNVADTLTEIIQPTSCVPVSITTQPANASVCTGNNTTISVTAAGNGPINYQWQVSTNGGTNWNNIPGATAATLALNGLTATENNNQYRVIVSNSCPSTITSGVSVLTVTNAAGISIQPVNVTTCTNSATFSVTATGSNPTYQWQVSTNGGSTFTNVAGATNSTLTISPVTGLSGNIYQVIVSSCGPTGVTSSPATLTANDPIAITAQPFNVATCNNSASFSIVAAGTGLGYQWQVSTNGGTNWANIAGQTSSTLNLTGLTTAQSGNQYRVVLTSTCTPAGTNSTAVTLTVNTPITISTQPVASVLCAGNNTSFSVTAAGSNITYQWQVSTNNGTSWTNVTGATNSTLNLTAVTGGMNGNLYRVVLNGPCTSNLNSDAVLLTVNIPVTITSQPANTSVCQGNNTTISIVAAGISVTYQWQASINGGPFVNLSNAAPYSGTTTSTLSINNASLSMNGYSYRVIVSGIPCGALTSSAAVLTVNPTPTVILTAASYINYTPYVSTGLYATTSPAGVYTYQWFKNNSPITVTASSFGLTGDDFGEYYVIATNTNGCSHTSNRVTVGDSASSLLFVYPNPTSGKFQVRYYNRGGGNVSRKLAVYDSKGAKVYEKSFNITGAYARMDVDLRKPGAGVYFVELLDASNKRLATGKVNIITR